MERVESERDRLVEEKKGLEDSLSMSMERIESSIDKGESTLVGSKVTEGEEGTVELDQLIYQLQEKDRRL